MAKQEANDYRRQVQALTCEVDALKGTVSTQLYADIVQDNVVVCVCRWGQTNWAQNEQHEFDW